MNTTKVALTAAILVGFPGLLAAQDKEEPSADEKERQEINAMAKGTLDRLFAESAGSKGLYDKAYGYAVFAGTQTALALAGGRGKGVAVEKTNGKRTYMKLTSVGAGYTFGAALLRWGDADVVGGRG